MSRRVGSTERHDGRFPRVGGDEPMTAIFAKKDWGFSPREWG